jgi:tryptophan synthase alpha chain
MLEIIQNRSYMMSANKIKDAFDGKKAFIAYLMAGDPNLTLSAEYILTAQDAGADIIEIGIPFSDPIAEGEVIEAAAGRALCAGTRLDGVFEMVMSIKDKMRIPMLFMTYANPVFVYGYDRFFSRCLEIGICGVIIPDMPFEEQGEAKECARKYGIEVISLIAPTSEKRMAEIARHAEGFIYLVSSLGVTGMRTEVAAELSSIISEIKKITDVPVAIGFGISTRDQVEYYSAIADGVIVGSAIVKIIGQHGKYAKQELYEYISEMSK